MNKTTKGLLFLGVAFLIAGLLLILANAMSAALDPSLRTAIGIVFIVADFFLIAGGNISRRFLTRLGAVVLLGIFVSNWRHDPTPVKEDYKRSDVSTFVMILVASIVFLIGSIFILWGGLLVTFILWTIAIYLIAVVVRFSYDLLFLTHMYKTDQQIIERYEEIVRHPEVGLASTYKQKLRLRHKTMMYNTAGTTLYLMGVLTNLIASSVQIVNTDFFIRTGNIIWIVGSTFIVMGSCFKIKQALTQSPRHDNKDYFTGAKGG